MLKVSILFSILCLQLTQQQDYQLHLVSQQNGAACLDGSAPSIYIHNGTGISAQNILIYFQGGGYCGSDGLAQTIENCYQRSKTKYGSSRVLNSTINFDGLGMLSTVASQNSIFYNWTKVHVNYCDGSEYLGNRSQTVPYKDSQLYFKGALNVMAVYEYLNKSYGLFDAKQIVISGQSAGGIATYLWSNYVYDRAPRSKVYSIPDSGVFLVDYYSPLAKRKVIRQNAKALMEIMEAQQSFPIPQCMQDVKGDVLECLNAINLIKYIKNPVLIVESLYDSWQLKYLLGVTCLQPRNPPFSLNSCNDTVKAVVEDFSAELTKTVTQMIRLNHKTGAWSPSCLQHGFLKKTSYGDPNFKVPSNTGRTVQQSIKAFLDDPSHPVMDIDGVRWPNNKGCNGIASQWEFISN